MSIRIKKALLIAFSALLALSVAVFGLSLKTKGAEAAEIVAGTSKTVSITEAYTFIGDDMTNKTAASDTPASGTSWNTTLGMSKFARGFNNQNHKFYMGFESVSASDYAFATFRTHLWGEGGAYTAPHQNVGASKTHNYLPTEIYTANNVPANYTVMVDMTYHDSGYPIEENVVSIPTSLLKDESGMVSGLIIKNPTTEGGWFMVSDVTFTNEARIVIDYSASSGSQGDTTGIVVQQESWGHASWQTAALRNRVQLASREKAFDVTIKFPTPLSASEVDYFSLKMLGWEDAKTVGCTIKNLDGTTVSTADVYFNWNTNGELNHTIPAAGLANSDGKIEGFIISSPSGATNFVFSDIKAVKEDKQATEAAILASNVTFKMGGTYGMNVYYDFDGAWGYKEGDHNSGWIVNATKTKGDVNMRLSISEETSSGGNSSSRVGTVRIPDLDSPYGNERGLFNANTKGAKDQTFSTGVWPGYNEFLMAYDSVTPIATVSIIGTSSVVQQTSGIIGKLTTYEAAKNCEYFGIGWIARAYGLKAKIQIYDADNNDLGITTSIWGRTKVSCNLTGKVGETIYFTPATAGTPTVTTAGGTNVEVTAGANGVYSFVMPPEAVTVAAAPEAETEVTFTVNGETNKTEKITWNEENFVAAIPSVSIADTKVVGYEYEGKLYKTGAALFAAIGTPAEAITVNIVALHLETVDGAEVRASGTAGLRFTSAVAKSAHVSAYGMILTVKTNVDNSGENDGVGLGNFTKENLDTAGYKYLETNSSESDFKSYEQDGNVIFSLVLTNIRDNHRDLQYVVRTYVTVSYEGGETVTCYSDVDFENNARSAHDVATSAIENKDINGLTEEQIAFLEENYLKKA